MPRRRFGGTYRPQGAARRAANGVDGYRPSLVGRDEVSPERQVYRDDVAFTPEPPTSRRPLSPDERETLKARIVELKARGLTDLDISIELDCSSSTVGVLRREAGAPGLPIEQHRRRQPRER